jgi:hypothetical protein
MMRRFLRTDEICQLNATSSYRRFKRRVNEYAGIAAGAISDDNR